MYVFLKPVYRIEQREGAIWLIHMTGDRHVVVNAPPELDTSILAKVLREGLAAGEPVDSIEKRTVAQLYKRHCTLFDTTAHSDLERSNGVRSSLTCLHHFHEFTPEQVNAYFECLEKTTVYCAFPNSERYEQGFKEMGIQKVEHLSPERLSRYKGGERSILILSHKWASSLGTVDGCQIFFDPNCRQLGPVYTPLNGVERPKAFPESVESDVPTPCLAVLHGLLYNSVLYLIGDVYKTLKVDVALPFRKVYTLEYPSMLIAVEEAPMA